MKEIEMTDDRQGLPAADTTEIADGPENPEERAFSGHPDHPPATPDETIEGNEELIWREDEAEEQPPAEI